jgi:hypothetical protein
MFTQRGDVIVQPIKKLKGSIMKSDDKFIEQLRGPLTYDIMEELGKRNEARVKQIIKEMGTKWLGHPDNAVRHKREAQQT